MMENGDDILSCKVRARIPTLLGGNFSIFLYGGGGGSGSKDLISASQLISPLALVFNNNKSADDDHQKIESTTLELWRDDDTERLRQTRGCQSDTMPKDPSPSTSKSSDHIPLVRVHSACFTGETVFSARCDCGQQLESAIDMMLKIKEPSVIIYLPQEGRSIGLEDKLKAYNLQDMGYDTVEANEQLSHPPDARQYSHAAKILEDLRIRKCRLLTNNPDKISQLKSYGIDIQERVPLEHKRVSASSKEQLHNYHEMCGYIRTKVERMGHLIELLPQPINSAELRKSL